jgi:hypothetical protein
VQNEDLAIAARSRADADGRDPERRGDPLRDRARHELENDRKRPRLLDAQRFLQQSLRPAFAPALYPEAAEGVH